MTANDKIPELTNNEFEEFIKEGTVLIDFFAEWCMPCLMMSPVIEELAEKFKDIKFVKVNVDESQQLANKFNVSTIPCLVVFKKGEEADT